MNQQQTTQTESQDQDEFDVTQELRAEPISFSRTKKKCA
jgi:hypothetical protein